MRQIIFLLSLLILNLAAMAQNERLTDHNSIGWYQGIVNANLGKKTFLAVDVQWRRTNIITDRQQFMARPMLGYKLNDNVSIGLGYAIAYTYIYGDYPTVTAEPTPDHRIFEQLQLTQPSAKFTFTHRFRVEQRWVARMKAAPAEGVDFYRYSNRFRYFFKAQRSLGAKGYIYAGDEVFVNAGKNVGQNLLDQNRLMGLLGFRLSGHVSVEGGYIKQSLIQGNRVNNKVIVQDNNGIVLAVLLKF